MTQININTKKLPLPITAGKIGINSKNLNSNYSRILNQQIDSNKIKNLNLESKTHKVQEKSLNSRVVGLTKLNSNLNSLYLKNLINNKSILSEVKANLSNKSVSITTASLSLGNEAPVITAFTPTGISGSLAGAYSLDMGTPIPFSHESGVTISSQGAAGLGDGTSNKPNPKKNMIADYVSYKKNQRGYVSGSQDVASVNQGVVVPFSNESGANNKFRLKKFLQTIYGFDTSLVDLILSKDLVYNFLPAGPNNIKKFKLDSILDNSFYTKKSLTGTKVFEITPNNVTLQLFLYSKKVLRIKNDYLDYLCAYISKKIEKPFNLNLIRLRNLKSDSVISAKAIGIVANKIKNSVRPVAYKFLRHSRVIKPKMVRNVFLKRGLLKLSFFTGIHIKLGGRLKRQRLTNRITTMTFQKGSLNRVSSDLLTTSRYTSKSVRGAFSITVTMGHKFF